MNQTVYSLRKSKKILIHSYSFYKTKGDSLNASQLADLEATLAACDEACLSKNREKASELSQKLELFVNEHFKKTPLYYAKELIFALIIALAIAVIVRQTWFELYEIPTGSMRPTFKEQDRLTVSKTQFGINIPLRTEHFYFDPSLVQRTGIVIWSGDGIPLPDTDTTYFGIFPYKKRYVKRLIGKPGDFLYFYGGKIYGIDKKGNPIEELLNSPWLEKIEYVPFMTFEGNLVNPSHGVLQFEQMRQPIGRLTFTPKGEWIGEVYDRDTWIKDQPAEQAVPHERIKAFSDFLGIRNYAMARLLTKNELKQYPDIDSSGLPEGVLYLELAHHPSLTYPKPFIRKNQSILSIALNPLTSIIPLQQKHLDALMNNMYTSRFEVEGGRAKRYQVNEQPVNATNPRFPGIPDGKYEFYYGKGVKIGWQGTTSSLSSDHPLYSHDPANVQNLYNYGIDFSTYFEPKPSNTTFYPRRYAYFRDGDLYLLGAPILKKEDPILKDFLAREEQRQKQSSESRPYTPFKDYGPPIKEGKIDAGFIKAFGVEIPAKNYLVLGDNHSVSSDSRIFGFLPQENLQGVPDLIIWPPQDMGRPAQKPYPVFTTPRLTIWALVILIAIGFYLFDRHRMQKPVFKKIER